MAKLLILDHRQAGGQTDGHGLLTKLFFLLRKNAQQLHRSSISDTRKAFVIPSTVILVPSQLRKWFFTRDKMTEAKTDHSSLQCQC